MRLTLLPSVVLFAAIGGLSSCHNGGGDSEAIKFLEQHANDPDALNDKFGREAQSACAEGANDYLRQVEVTPSNFHENVEDNNSQNFGKALASLESSYVLILSKNIRKPLNSSEFPSNTNFYCFYNVQLKKVLKYSLNIPQSKNIANIRHNILNKEKNTDNTVLYNEQTAPDSSASIFSEKVIFKEKENKNLDQEAANFLLEYYHMAEQSPDQAILWMPTHYKPVVDFFGKSQSLNQIIAQKRTYLTRWPIRSYRLLTDTVTHQCNQTNMICQSMGTLEFDAQSPERKAASHGKASFVLSVDFSGNTPQITSENSQVISR
ncbi:MAG: hypothetical protein ABF697_02595 [Zymomonas mobilis]|uniref:hypothetical protein n=1 Tax=Zymomonas mobilis TaxID=542 RepID=UPI0039E91B72